MAKYDVTKSDRTKYTADGKEIMGGAYDDPVYDMFSAETVHAAESGEWGSGGTPGADYNAQQAQQGNTLQNQHQGQGQTALAKYGDAAATAGQVASSEANNATIRANDLARRGGPTTDFSQANNAGAGTERTLNALNNFAANQNGPSAAQAQLRAPPTRASTPS